MMRSGTTVDLATTRLYEGLSSITMRANARALLARVQALECDNAEDLAGSAVHRADALLRATAQ